MTHAFDSRRRNVSRPVGRSPAVGAALTVVAALLAVAAQGAAAQQYVEYIALNIERQPPRVLPQPEDFASITAGDNHTCVTRVNGNTYCWGANNSGQVGMASTTTCSGVACVDRPRFVMTAKTVEAGSDHSCALDANGKAFCWGNSNYGQLGNGNYGYMAQPIAVSGGHTFTSISAGQFSTCGTTAGGMYCWGAIVNALSGAPTPSQVFAWSGYQTVSVGYLHACALDVIGSWRAVDCWGNNPNGQAGIDPLQFPIVPPTLRSSFGTAVARVSAQTGHTCVDQLNGTVQCAGYNGWGQLGNGGYAPTHQPQTVGSGMALHGVSSSGNHNCALDSTKRAYCWGNGYWGQLGNGASDVYPQPQPVAGGRTFRAIATGHRHTCAIGTDNNIYCWGNNHYGQLGTQYPGGWVWSPVQTLTPI